MKVKVRTFRALYFNSVNFAEGGLLSAHASNFLVGKNAILSLLSGSV